MSDMSRQMKEMRGQLESDDQLKSLMAGLRGANVDDSDFADKDVVMQLVEVDRDEQDQLPQVQHGTMGSALCSQLHMGSAFCSDKLIPFVCRSTTLS